MLEDVGRKFDSSPTFVHAPAFENPRGTVQHIAFVWPKHMVGKGWIKRLETPDHALMSSILSTFFTGFAICLSMAAFFCYITPVTVATKTGRNLESQERNLC